MQIEDKVLTFGIVQEIKKKLFVCLTDYPDLAWVLTGPLKDNVSKGNYVKGYYDKTGFFVKEIIGHESDKDAAVIRTIEKYGVRVDYDPKAIESLKDIPDNVLEKELNERVSFLDYPVVTIDSDDAKDLDDAVYVEKKSNGNYSLDVHIADVSHYIKENTALDKEALKRGTSIYLADRVIAMLPKKLSNGICSLNENVLRLTLTCQMEINKAGKVVKEKIIPSYIKTKFRMSYKNVNRILKGEEASDLEVYNEIKPMFFLMNELSEILKKRRDLNGAINFVTSESEFILDDNLEVVEIKERLREESEMLIEEFMLIANETVAKKIYEMKLPFLYRVHDDPENDKLKRAFAIISSLNLYETKEKLEPSAKIRKVLEKTKASDLEKFVGQLILRSMAKARYSGLNSGHFGLASNCYTHFTSPIRRYPDLVVHRYLRRYLFEKERPKNFTGLNEKMNKIGNETSKSERTAIDLERDVESIYRGKFLNKYLGNEFIGRVSSVTSFGMFVQLENTCEGLIHISSLKGYYNFIEDLLILVNEKTQECFQLGDKLLIKVENINSENGKADFKLMKVLNPHIYHPKRKKGKEKYENYRTKQKGKF